MVINVEFTKHTIVTLQWMRRGQGQIVVPAWYTRYCTAGAQKLLYHAARTVRAYNTVVTHRQYKKSNHQIHHGEITNDKTTINKNNKTTMLKLTRNERETEVEQEAERERKEDNKA